MNRAENREFLSERIARMEERMISMSRDVTDIKNVMEKSFSSYGDMANRVGDLENFKKFILVGATAFGSMVGYVLDGLLNSWRGK